ncbi:MAG: hypothetical protein ACI8UP_005527 [Porticoccaceae bacterium]|jgi:hypothetical protein
MGIILNQELTGPSVWAGRDLAQDDSWIHHLDDSAILEIESALLRAKNSALATEELTLTKWRISDVEALENQPEAQGDFEKATRNYSEDFDYFVMRIELGDRTGN